MQLGLALCNIGNVLNKIHFRIKIKIDSDTSEVFFYLSTWVTLPTFLFLLVVSHILQNCFSDNKHLFIRLLQCWKPENMVFTMLLVQNKTTKCGFMLNLLVLEMLWSKCLILKLTNWIVHRVVGCPAAERQGI